MRALKRSKFYVAGIAATALVLACTTKTAEDNTSNTLLTVVSIVTDDGDRLNSDVCPPLGFGAPSGCPVADDAATVTIRATAKSLLPTLGPSYYNDVVFDRYRVTYTRSDGRNTAGVDVPYAFDGALNLQVAINSTGSATLTVVRYQAKLEPPLKNLVALGGAVAITTLAQVDFYGTDGAGRPVSATGHITITFSDF